MLQTVTLDGQHLTPAMVAAVAGGAHVELAPAARERMQYSADWFMGQDQRNTVLDKLAVLVGRPFQPEQDVDVARWFIIGHCAAVGKPLSKTAVRALMVCRAAVLANGYSGVRPTCVDTLVAMLNADVVPVVPRQGSVGAAGDLAPLAHLMRVACGYGGEAWRDGQRLPAVQAMAGIPLLAPNEKEALSLINGATLTVALAALATHRAHRLLETAEAAGALAFEVVRADTTCLSREALGARGHAHGVAVAERLCAQLEGSGLTHRGRKPDPFSIRCTPAVLGAASHALEYVDQIVRTELSGACDNPLVFPDGEGIVEAGNFHGAPVALAMDHLKVALTQVASLSERRTFRMTYGQLSGLPSFLMKSNGKNSGLMLAQYTAASLVSECKGLSHPASVDTIPTVQHHEDHVSMGPIAARGALAITEALADVLAIELLCGAQGLDLHVEAGTGQAGEGTRRTYESVRRFVDQWHDDQVLKPDLDALGAAVRSGVFATPRGPW